VGRTTKASRRIALNFRIRIRLLTGTNAVTPACFAVILLSWRNHVQIRAGYDIAFQCFQETPMVLMLSIEPARVSDLQSEHRLRFSPEIPSREIRTCSGTPAPGSSRRPA
jgi:hypothetical protein